MQGITGFFSTSGKPEVGEAALRVAVASLRAAGAMEQPSWFGGSEVGLGGTRARSLCARAPGPQTTVSADGQLVMVHCGEIYNAAELRAELAASGRVGQGSGDADVILAALQAWGAPQAARRLLGTFSIAVWDARAGRLTLIRDRMGVQPLYYGWNGRTLWFGSELKALRAYPHWLPRIDLVALADFFRYAYIVEPRTIYQQVCKLAPGHVLVLARAGQPDVQPYWGVLDDFRSAVPDCDEEQRADELEALLADACERRMLGDAPVGVFLSGGVDSSVVTALMQRRGMPLRTFTIGFDDPRYNEAHHAEQVARHLGTVHTTQIVREAQAMQVLPTWGELYDEPFGDSSGIPTFLAARLAAEHVPVVLMADGADELFGSYRSYEAVFARVHPARPGSVPRRAVRGLADALPWDRLDNLLAGRASSADPSKSLLRRATRHLRYLRETGALNTPGKLFEYSQTSSNWHDADLARLLGRDAGATRSAGDSYPGTAEEGMRLWELDHYTGADILTKVDRSTGAAGVVVREPLLDQRVVALALSLPEGMRHGSLGSKHLLRKVLYRHVPRELIERPKMGFAPPIGRWMAGGLRPMLDQYLDPRRIAEQGLLDPRTIRTVRGRFGAGDPASVQRVWLLLAFQMWHARCMETGSSRDGWAAKLPVDCPVGALA